MSNLILIGFMGCGKSTLGIRLSYRLRKPFLDTDKQIENEQKMSISELFEKQGEMYFRDLETNCLKDLFDAKEEYVISTGGGIVLREENRRLLKELGTVVYLKVTPQTVYERLKNDKTRPLLKGENPFEKMNRMMEQRNRFYEDAAQIIVEADDKSIEELTDEISNIIGKKEEKQNEAASH